VIGEHVGLAFYTLGQRKGIGIGGRRNGSGAPWFVAKKEIATNTLWVVQGHDHPWLLSDRLRADDAVWVSGSPPAPGTRLTAKTRYRQADARCTVVRVEGNSFELQFDQPQWAITPGQYATLYQGEVSLGGGMITA
jgi:tRNA-specific 2-thiouridylase